MSSSLHLGSAVTAAFLASLVEAVEALTIVLAASTVRGWRPAGLGAFAGLLLLAFVVVAIMLSAFAVFWVGEGVGYRNHRLRPRVPSCRDRRCRTCASRQQESTAMSALIGLVRQLVGLYVDDGWLALGIICIVALVALLVFLMPSLSLEAGAILLFGCLALLLTNVVWAAHGYDDARR